MCFPNFGSWWDTIKVENSCMTAAVWLRVIATLNQYVDAEEIRKASEGDSKAIDIVSRMTAREKKFAAYLTEMPSFCDWAHYNFFVSSSFMGPCGFIEYGTCYDYLNM